MGWIERIEVGPQAPGGKPVIKGTRIQVEVVLELIERGWSRERILQHLGKIGPEDIDACVTYGAQHKKRRTP